MVSADPLTNDLHICDAGVLTTTAMNGTQSVQENAMVCRPNYVIDLVKIGYLKVKRVRR